MVSLATPMPAMILSVPFCRFRTCVLFTHPFLVVLYGFSYAAQVSSSDSCSTWSAHSAHPESRQVSRLRQRCPSSLCASRFLLIPVLHRLFIAVVSLRVLALFLSFFDFSLLGGLSGAIAQIQESLDGNRVFVARLLTSNSHVLVHPVPYYDKNLG